MHALIIEDDGLIAIMIEDALSDCGFSSFDVAASLKEGVTAAIVGADCEPAEAERSDR